MIVLKFESEIKTINFSNIVMDNRTGSYYNHCFKKLTSLNDYLIYYLLLWYTFFNRWLNAKHNTAAENFICIYIL